MRQMFLNLAYAVQLNYHNMELIINYQYEHYLCHYIMNHQSYEAFHFRTFPIERLYSS